MPSEIVLTRAGGASNFRIGEVVHVIGDRAVARAQADVDASVAGALGLSLGWTVVFGGVFPVLLEAGLAPAAQDTLFVSASQAGRATTTEPAISRPFATILDASRYAIDGTVICVLAGGGAAGGGCGDCECAKKVYRVEDHFDSEPTNNPHWMIIGDVKLVPAQGGAWRLTVAPGGNQNQSIAVRAARSIAFAGNTGAVPNPPLVFFGEGYYTPGPNVGDGFAAFGLVDFAHNFVLAAVTAGPGNTWALLAQAGGPQTFTPTGIPVGDSCENTNTFEVRQQADGNVRLLINGIDLGIIPVDAVFRAHLYSVVCFIQGPSAFAIVDASNTNPIVIDTGGTPHGYTTGQQVIITGVTGNTAANGTWTITVVDPTHFSLDGSIGNGAYVDGGDAVLASTAALTAHGLCATEGLVCLDDPGDVPFPPPGDLIQTQSNFQSNDVPDNSDNVGWTTIPVAVNLTTRAGTSLIAWAEISSSQVQIGERNEFRWIVDGVPVSASSINVGVGSTFNTASIAGAVEPPATSFPQGNAMILPKQTGLAAGAHSIGIQWRVSGGTGLLRPGTFPDRESISIVVAEVAV